MTPDDIIQAANTAAKQDDRWLFVALLIVGLVTIYFLARYFMSEIAKSQQEIVEVRKEFQGYLSTQNTEVVAALAKSSMVIAQNSEALADLRSLIKQTRA